MELEQLRARLELVLGRDVVLERGVRGADHGSGETDGEPGDGGSHAFELDGGRGRIVIRGKLTASELGLIELLLESCRALERRPRSAATEEERQSLLLSQWLLDRMEQGDIDATVPDTLAMWPALGRLKVPLLLYGDYPERSQDTSYYELRKLLTSFFEADIMLVPLHNKQWLILGDESLLAEQRGEEDETIEESLSAIASGLHDMAASEWMGECRVAATYPFSPAASLVNTVMLLRETMELGKAFRMSSNIHLPWELRLEALLDSVPKRFKLRFLEGVLQRSEPAFEPETLQTLEAFFAENCNVSDTAKRLYIHRNTLLYRLDKFKQETGMDVRDFGHAVLVRLALLLYKVTKRK